MKNVGNAILVFLGIVLVSTMGVVMIGVSFNNTAVSQENGVVATYRDSQVWYDNFWKKVSETAQVTDKYKDDFKDVFLGSIEGRYENSKPTMFIMESNPTLDPALYTKVQDVIEAGRNDFSQTQRTLVDRQREYNTTLQTFPNSAMAGFLGFPKEVQGELRPTTDTDGDGKFTVLDYPIVTSQKTKAVFQAGEDNAPLNVFED